jgi:hypothetical protein
MQLFEAYCTMLEGSIQRVLQAAVPGLGMQEFAAMLEERQGQLGAEVRAAVFPVVGVAGCIASNQACRSRLSHMA